MMKNTHLQYSLWVEDKIITAGQERLVENSLGLWGESMVAEKLKKKLEMINLLLLMETIVVVMK